MNGAGSSAGTNPKPRPKSPLPRHIHGCSHRPRARWTAPGAVQLPNGMIAVTDDWHHRVILIDPQTKKIISQYGHGGQPGSAPGYLNKPDGLQLIG